MELYRYYPQLVHSDDQLLVAIWRSEGIKSTDDIVNKRVTSFKTVDRAARSVRKKMGVVSMKRVEAEYEIRNYFAKQSA